MGGLPRRATKVGHYRVSEKKINELKDAFAAQKQPIEVDFRRGAMLGIEGRPSIQPAGVEVRTRAKISYRIGIERINTINY